MPARSQLLARTVEFVPNPLDNLKLANLCGPLDQNLRQIETCFDVQIARRGEQFSISGRNDNAASTLRALQNLYALADKPIDDEQLQLSLTQTRTLGSDLGAAQSPSADTPSATTANGSDDSPTLLTRRGDLQGRTPRQRAYLRSILAHGISFGIGPAGTGKTFLAVACAVDALERDTVKRIILTRPAVEAGERLGFLPGDLTQKVDPYLRPLYDALNDLMGVEKAQRMFDKQVIEIAPLAYMRGRTLNHAFIILDEAQNTSPEQMKMFLTRMGYGSKMVITGDVTQIDLPRSQPSGLLEARRILSEVAGISFTEFSADDVVRHPLVAKIVAAYERHTSANRDK